MRGSAGVAEVHVTVDGGGGGGFHAEQDAAAVRLAGLHFGAEGGAVQQAGGLEGLARGGRGAAGKRGEGGVGIGAVEAG